MPDTSNSVGIRGVEDEAGWREGDGGREMICWWQGDMRKEEGRHM